MSQGTIETSDAPAAIGVYSQARRCGSTVYLSGQIPLDPRTQELVGGDIKTQIERVIGNLRAVVEAAGGRLEHVVKLTVYLTDLGNFQAVNEVMAEHFAKPYPARAAVGVAALPKGAEVEMDAIVELPTHR